MVVKQDIFRKIGTILSIDVTEKSFSTGSTVTKKGIQDIMKSITDRCDKHESFILLCHMLSIPVDNDWLSSGGTVTSDGWEAVLNVLEGDKGVV